MENKESPKNSNIFNNTNEEYPTNINLKMKFLYDLIIKNSNKNLPLSDLHKEINRHYFLNENEYELLIGEKTLDKNISNDFSLFDIINKYKDNKITIKTFKNIFDTQKQINNYEHFLDNNILKKKEEIKSLDIEYSNFIKDLNSI
jgi:hypothetical protein